MSAMVIFGGHVSEEGANARHALRINAVMILSVKYVANESHRSTLAYVIAWAKLCMLVWLIAGQVTFKFNKNQSKGC